MGGWRGRRVGTMVALFDIGIIGSEYLRFSDWVRASEERLDDCE